MNSNKGVAAAPPPGTLEFGEREDCRAKIGMHMVILWLGLQELLDCVQSGLVSFRSNEKVYVQIR